MITLFIAIWTSYNSVQGPVFRPNISETAKDWNVEKFLSSLEFSCQKIFSNVFIFSKILFLNEKRYVKILFFDRVQC